MINLFQWSSVNIQRYNHDTLSAAWSLLESSSLALNYKQYLKKKIISNDHIDHVNHEEKKERRKIIKNSKVQLNLPGKDSLESDGQRKLACLCWVVSVVQGSEQGPLQRFEFPLLKLLLEWSPQICSSQRFLEGWLWNVPLYTRAANMTRGNYTRS